MNVNICRVCMCSLYDTTEVVPIFDNFYRNSYNLVALISELFDVKIGINDVLSKVMCQYCADQIVEFYKFHDMLLESDRKLRLDKIEEDVMNITDSVVPDIVLTNDSVKEEICVEAESILVRTCDNQFESQALLDNHGCEDATDKFENLPQKDSTKCCKLKQSSVAGTPIKIDRKSTKKCQKCKMNFASKYNLERHIKYKHESSSLSILQCEQCEITFASKFNLKRHIEHRHEKSSNHACDDAKDKFERKAQKRQMKHRHEKSSNHACEDAEDKFENIAQKHSTEFCTFKQPSAARSQTKIETKSTKKCQLCKMTFVSKYNLERHIKNKHELSSSSIVKCEQCEATFASKSNLKRHINHRHEKSSNNACEDAKDKFENKAQKRHIKHRHEKSSNHASEDAKGSFENKAQKRHIKHRHEKSSAQK